MYQTYLRPLLMILFVLQEHWAKECVFETVVILPHSLLPTSFTQTPSPPLSAAEQWRRGRWNFPGMDLMPFYEVSSWIFSPFIMILLNLPPKRGVNAMIGKPEQLQLYIP